MFTVMLIFAMPDVLCYQIQKDFSSRQIHLSSLQGFYGLTFSLMLGNREDSCATLDKREVQGSEVIYPSSSSEMVTTWTQVI